MLRVIGFFFLVVALCGCGQPLRKDDAALSGSDSYYVFGLTPSNYKVQIFPGSIGNDGKFTPNPFLNATFNSVADQGYAVGKARPGSVLAITRIYVKDSSSLLSPAFVPCTNADTMVFTAAKGKVIYLADVDYRFSGDKLEVRYGNHIEGARKYLEANYPNLAPLLEQGELRFSKTNIPCKNTIYIPVYLPH